MSKLEDQKDQLIKDWGESSFNDILHSLLNISKLLEDQQNKAHENESGLTEYAMITKGRSFARRIGLKLKNVIKKLEELLNKNSEINFKLLRTRHRNKYDLHTLVNDQQPVLGCTDYVKSCPMYELAENWLKSA